MRSFFSADFKQRTTQTIKQLESQTSAELVVVVRKQSGDYRHVDLALASGTALLMLFGFLFHPEDFHEVMVLTSVALTYAAALAISSAIPQIRARLSHQKTQNHNVRQAALAAFSELGISHTTGRTGILAYVSLLEKRIELIADTGVRTSLVARVWQNKVDQCQKAIDQNDPDAVLKALGDFTPMLSQLLPRQENDVNELPDEVQS